MVCGSFGPIVFGVSGSGQGFLAQEIQATKKTKFVEHEILLSKPIVEFVGYENDKVSFEMIFLSPYTTAPSVAITLLNALVVRPTPFPLIIGDKSVGGWASMFIITEINTTYKYIGTDGAIQGAHVKVSAQEYNTSTTNAGILSLLGSI
jgi:phage protein U